MGFTLDDLAGSVNRLSEESSSVSELIDYFNDCIASINIEAGANYPFFSSSDSSFDHPIPDNWKRMLFIPYVVGRVKQQDSSQFEYTDAYTEYGSNLQAFIARYVIPDEYKASDQVGSHELEVSESPWSWSAPFTSKGPLDE